jgi:hypothetical protein
MDGFRLPAFGSRNRAFGIEAGERFGDELRTPGAVLLEPGARSREPIS